MLILSPTELLVGAVKCFLNLLPDCRLFFASLPPSPLRCFPQFCSGGLTDTPSFLLYLGLGNGVQNIVNHYQGKARQNSLATAATNITKPRAHYLRALRIKSYITPKGKGKQNARGRVRGETVGEMGRVAASLCSAPVRGGDEGNKIPSLPYASTRAWGQFQQPI